MNKVESIQLERVCYCTLLPVCLKVKL